MSEIKRCVVHAGRLEMSGHLIAIADGEDFAEQHGSVSFALLRRIDAHERQIPMRLARACLAHLFKQVEEVGTLLLVNAARDHIADFFFVRFNAGGQPERCAGAGRNRLDSLIFEGFSAYRPNELGEVG